jgi:hypothetical protein
MSVDDLFVLNRFLARMKRTVAPNGTAPLALRSATVERVAGRND